MSDRCRLWRRNLTRRADGTLSNAQWGALENHLAQCRRCQEAARADQALRTTLRTHTGLLDARAAGTLDDHVVGALFSARGTPTGARPRRPETAPARPVVYLLQIMSSAIAAAAVTALLVFPALHPTATSERGERYPATFERSEPPVPLGSLLQTMSPRAALLWTQPEFERGQAAAAQAPVVQPPPPDRGGAPTRRQPAANAPSTNSANNPRAESSSAEPSSAEPSSAEPSSAEPSSADPPFKTRGA